MKGLRRPLTIPIEQHNAHHSEEGILMAAKLTDLASIESILSEMSLEEKAELVIGGSPMSSAAMAKYGIPSLFMIDCCNGVNTFQYAVDKIYQETAKQLEEIGQPVDREKLSTMGGLFVAVGALQKKAAEAKAAGQEESPLKPIISYPTGISQASTWDPEVAGACAREVAKEFVKFGVDLILSPNVNIHRDPCCGRLTESYSEDPYLVSRIAESVVKNLNAEGVIAEPKHFAANSQEQDRLEIDEKIPERVLREIYLPAFKACVDAGAMAIMSAYNKINGESCAMNRWLLTDILKKEWGFEGCVISDWGASYEQVPSVYAGTDLTMPGPRGIQCIIDAVKDGTLPLEQLEDSCRRILRVIVKSAKLTERPQTFSLEEASQVVENAAREGLILLKNDGVLPADPAVTKLVFYGKRAKTFTAYSEGSGKVPSMYVTHPYDRAAELLGAENVSFEEPMEGASLFVAVVGADGQEGADRPNMDMDADDRAALEKAITDCRAAGGKLVLITNSSGPVTITQYEADCNAILCPFFAGQAGGKAVVDAIFGLCNPSGKLPDTWPMDYKDTPAFKNYGGENKEVWYGEGIYVGYRWYETRGIRPLYPFGHGLSYTHFAYSDLAAKDTDVDQESIEISAKVRNDGECFGAEVVQLYIASPKTDFDKPEKELKGFKKIRLAPGETAEVTFTVSKQDLAHYSTALSDWITEPGTYGICVGSSSADIRLQKEIRVSCRDPFGWTVISGIGKLVSNPKAVEIMNTAIQADIMLVAAVPIQYAPDRTLKQIWDGTMIRTLFESQGRTAEDMKDAWAYIVKEFKEL